MLRVALAQIIKEPFFLYIFLACLSSVYVLAFITNIVEEQTDTSIFPIMKKDILLSMGVRTLIINTKYYTEIMHGQYSRDTLRSGHLYQINTYINEYDSNHCHNVDGMLLYAKTKGAAFDDAQITFRDGYSIYIRTLDLNTDFESIKKRLEAFIHL